MYQALYRKWRPRTFDDVVGQEHITETLKRQVAQDRLSHAYLFTGTRGTGKTTCAKILARAVNCEHPVDGNPCNCCPSCKGIESGGVLDVLELDAASNNGVDQIRALRDEAIYTPAAVRKRVYIVDEVHMLTVPAFNALLKILEEPPAHLMFILATTELHKVPATVKSRCQQFAFKRITPRAIADQLERIAQAEGLTLTQGGADLLARLADGGLRDALSLLDQCSGGEGEISEDTVLEVLGLAGNRRTARLLDCIAREDTTAALEELSALYQDGKDMGALLGELSALIRDLLIRKTAPEGGRGLLTGGYDEKTVRPLLEGFTAAELVQMLTILQSAQADLYRSSSRRLDAELCLIRLCDRRLSDSVEGLTARISRLEQKIAQGWAAPVPNPVRETMPEQKQPAGPKEPVPEPKQEEQAPPPQEEPPLYDEAPPPWEGPEPGADMPPWEEEPPKPAPAPSKAEPPAPKALAPAAPRASGSRELSWAQIAAGMTGLRQGVVSLLRAPGIITGVFDENTLTIWVDNDTAYGTLSNAKFADKVAQFMESQGMPKRRVLCKVGKPSDAPPIPPVAAPEEKPDPFQELLGLTDRYANFKKKS